MTSTAQVSGVDLGKRLKALQLKRSGLALGLHGAAGIGKTHTAQTLLRQTPCPSFSLHSTASLKQWLQTLPKPKTLELWAERLLERLAAGEPLATADAANALGTLLARLAPVVLYLEDIHEASPERLELITRLAEIVQRSKGVGLLLTSRNSLPEPIETIPLEPLSAEGSKSLLEAHAGTELPAEALEWIFAKAAGNPLFSLEYFRHLARAGNLWNDGQRWRWREPERRLMPSTVEALVERTLAEASKLPELQQTLEAKAILGLNTDQKLWSTVADLSPEDLKAGVQALERQGIIRAGEFAHPLYGEVLLHNLPTDRHKALARRALEALTDDPVAVARFVQDAALSPEESLGWLQRAANLERDSGNSLQAARLLAQAMQYATGEARGQLALEAANRLGHHDWAMAERLAAEAVRLCPDEPQAVYLQARALAALQRGKEALELLNQLPPAELHSEQVIIQRMRMHSSWGDTASVVELWQAHPELKPTAEVSTIQVVANALRFQGDKVGALALIQEALGRPDLGPGQRANLTLALGKLYYDAGEYSEAEQKAQGAIQIRQQASLPPAAASHFQRTVALLNMGRHQDATHDLEQALRLSEASGSLILYAFARLVQGDYLIDLGRYEQAEEVLQAILETAQRWGILDALREIHGSLHDLYCDWGVAHGGVLAVKHARAALDCARQISRPGVIVLPEAMFYVVLTEAQFGDPRRALELSLEHQAEAERAARPRQLWKAAWGRGAALAALGRAGEALEAYQYAHAIASQHGAVMYIHRMGLEVARLTNDLNLAREHLAWFEERGLMNGVNIAHRYFPELAQQPQPIPLEARMRLEALGPLQVVIDGQSHPVRGQKRRELLALLLESRLAGRREVGKLELLEALYPDTDEQQASTALKDVVYALREVYSPAGIQTTEGGYALGEVGSDAEAFLRSGDTRLWRGSYLEGLSLEGDATVREALYLSLQTRAEALLENDPNEAARLGQLLLEADPYAPEYLRLTLSALHKAKYYKGLSRTYARARERMSEVGQSLPDRWQAFVDKNP